MPDTYVIEYEERHATQSRQYYRTWNEGQVFVESCKDPFHDCARELLTLGAGVDDRIMVYGRGDPTLRMSGRIGNVAAHTITEGNNSGPRKIVFVPYTGPEADDDG